ncbi:MAG: glycosyltransferase family 9 protein [Alphaproteobacteria bacterium]|nr:glycosyltransferase family 9 protein [Alphaproteobacteria bacterium]
MNVLFVTSNRIGDAMLSTGVLAHLVDTMPEARFTVACGPLAAPLFAALPRRAATIELRKGPAKLHWLSLWARTVANFWELVVDMRGSGLAWFLPARRRAILAARDPALHRVESAAGVLRISPVPSPRLWLADDAKAEARAIAGEGRLLVLGATANWSGKVWPAERFAALASALAAPGTALAGARVAVVGGPGERAMAAPLLEALGPAAVDLVGTAPLATVAAVIARAALYVGNDSGLMHVAAASGVPTLGLFGPSDDRHFRPWGANAAFVRTKETKDELFARIEFQPQGAHSLLGSIGVDQVRAAAEALLARRAEHAA